MKKKRGGALALPCTSENELFIRDIEASAQKVLRKAYKVKFAAILAEARKSPKLLVNGGGHGNRKSASCSPPKRRGGGSSCKLTTVLSKRQVGIDGAPSSSKSSSNVDSVVGSVDGNYKYDYYNNSSTTTNLPWRAKNNCLKEDCCDIINKAALKKNASQELPTAASAQLTLNATPGIHHSKATTTQYPLNIESSKTKATRSSFLSSFPVARPHSSTPINKKLGGKQRLSTHSPKRKLRMNGGEKERKQCYPISWNIDELRTKYRSEEIRRRDHEDAAVAKATTAAEDILVSERVMFSVDSSSVTTTTAANPHPIHKALRQQLDMENSRSLLHAATKSRKQRFSLDVHQAWVSNLSHLKEFKETCTISKKSAVLCSECQTSHFRKIVLASSLGNRRDTEAILAEKSQIQSVNMLRAFDKAIKGYPAPWKMDSDAWLSKEKESERGGGRTTNKNSDYDEVKVHDNDLPNLLSSSSSVCLQRAHIYKFMSLSSTQQQKQNNDDNAQIEKANNESPHQRNAYLIQIDRCCPGQKAAADGRGDIIKEEATWIIRWCHLLEKGGNNRGGYYSGGVHLSESVVYKCVFNAIEKGNLIEGHELHSSLFKLRQLNASGEVTNHIYCVMHFGLKPAVLSNGIRNVLSVVAYPLTGNLRSIGPQKTIIAVGDLLGNMGLASPVHVLYSDVCTNEYLDYLKKQLICNGAQVFAFAPFGPIGPIMEMGETAEKMKLLVVPQGSCTNDGLLSLPPISLSKLQLLHARTVACAMLCLLQLKENHEEEGILLQQIVDMAEEDIHNNTTGVLFRRLDPSEISHWEDEKRFRIAQVQEDQFLQGKENVGDGRQVKGMMCTEVVFSGIIKQHANNTAAAANPSSHHPIFASFFGDNTRSSTDSIMVHLTASTPDVPMIMDSVTVHENKMLVPIHLPHDPRPDNRPLVMNPMPRKELFQLSSQSEVAKVYNLVEGFAPGIMVLNCLSQIEDYTFEGLLEEREAFKAGVHHRHGLKGTALGPFIRAIDNTTTPPSSSTCMLPPLTPCDKLETLSYGITRQVAVGNVTRVKGRCIFHSNQRCIEQFSRKRTPKDYAYISKTRLMAGIGDTSCHYVTLIHQQIRGIFRISRKRYEMDQKEAGEKRRK